MSKLHHRILEISKQLRLSHLGSCLTSVDIIDEIYRHKRPDEPFILSSGHAGLALYVVLERYLGLNAMELFKRFGTHPDRCMECGIWCSTGSLGHGLGIALGMALANRNRNVYCLVSDGECFEGSVWEAANVIEKYNVTNLKLHLNFNGWSAYDGVSELMCMKIQSIFPDIIVHRTKVEDYGLKGLTAHYVKICEGNLGKIYSN